MELYIHIPFCVRKCRYCDFLSFASDACVREKYVDQLIREIESIPEEDAGQCPENAAPRLNLTGRTVETIFIGGGTPSLLPPSAIERILAAVRQVFRVEPDAEITMEANPGTLTPDSAAGYRNAGVNRLSLGLQSASEEELRLLGRIHTREQFLQSFRAARDAGFDNINVDLMSALPGQSEESWQETLRFVCDLEPEHISAYSLIIEQGTPFWEQYGPGMGGCRRENVLPLPDEDTENRIYHLTRDFLGEMGYQRYEISNYAKPGKECRHNIGYWTEVSYLGLGLGASSYMDGCRFSNEKDLRRYLALDLEHDCGEGLRELAGPVEQLSREARMEEFMFLGLRMTRGVSEMDFVRLFGVKMETVYGAVIERLMANGLLKKEGVWLSLTEWGMDVSNFVLSEFLLS